MKGKWAVPVIFSILITSGFGISQQAFAQIPPGFVDFNGHCYGLTLPNTWEGAEQFAVANFGAHLVTIDNVAENTFVQTISSPGNSWIGYNDVDVEGTFVWVSGLVTGYENWRPGEPSGSPGEDAVAFITADAGWANFPNSNILTGIVELPFTCEPAPMDDVVAEKTWTETDYNWDRICTLFNPDPPFNCLTDRPANVDNPADDVLADTLPLIDDKYQVQAHANKNKFQNTNPGAFYALTTVDVLNDLPAGPNALTVWEDYSLCTDDGGGILKFVSKKATRNVKVAIADPLDDVTELTDDLYDGVGGTITATIDSAHVHLDGPIPAGSTVYVLVKFQDNLKGDAAPGNVFMDMCDNSERVMTANTDITVNAVLRITTTPLVIIPCPPNC